VEHPSEGYFGHAPGPPLARSVALIALDDALAARVAMRVAALGGWPLVDVVRGVAHALGRAPTPADLRAGEPALVRRALRGGQGSVISLTRDALLTETRALLADVTLVYLRTDPGADHLARAELEARRVGFERAAIALQADGVAPHVLAGEIVERVRP
jgi:hypothetical protein